MALSNSHQTYFGNGNAFSLILEWTSSENIANKTSTITARVYLKGNYSYSTLNDSAVNTGSISIDGKMFIFSANSSITGTQKKLLGTVSKTITYGSTVFDIVAVYNVNATFGGNYISHQSVAINARDLDTRPRIFDFIVSSTTAMMDSPMTVKVNDTGSGFEAWLYINLGSKRVSVGKVPVGSDFSVTPKVSDFASQIPNATSGVGSYEIETWQGSIKIGSVKVDMTLTLPATVVPTISSVGLTDSNSKTSAVLGDGVNFVQGLSTLKFDIVSAGVYGSKYRAMQIDLGGKSYTTNIINLSDVGQLVGAQTAKIWVQDTRYRWSTVNKAITIATYNNPGIALNVSRALSDGVLDDDGTFVKLAVTSQISPILNKNSKSLKLEYKETTNDSWTAIEHNLIDYKIDSFIMVPGITLDSAFEFRATLSDSFGTASFASIVSTSFATVDYKAGGHGVAFGRSATQEGVWFDRSMPIFVNGDTIIKAVDDKDDVVGKLMAIDLIDTGWVALGTRSDVWYRVKNGFLQLKLQITTPKLETLGQLPLEYVPEASYIVDLAVWSATKNAVVRLQINGKSHSSNVGNVDFISAPDVGNINTYSDLIMLG